MPFTNNPITAEQANENNYTPWPHGQYKYFIKSAIEKKSSNGNDMIEFELEIYNGTAKRDKKTWLVFTASMQWQVRRFYESINRVADYDSGMIDASKLIGAQGVLLLKIGSYEKDGETKPTNEVETWIKPSDVIAQGAPTQEPPKAVAQPANAPTQPEEEDDIPF